jgi:hypothetical protein
MFGIVLPTPFTNSSKYIFSSEEYLVNNYTIQQTNFRKLI